MTSVSEVDWKMEPAASSSCRSRPAFDQVAVVADRDRPAVALDQVRLGVRRDGVAGGRVADVADRAIAGKPGQDALVEDVVDEAHPPLEPQLLAVPRGDARRLLAAVLEGVEAHVREVRRLGVAEDAEEAALVVEAVVVRSLAGEGRRQELLRLVHLSNVSRIPGGAPATRAC